MSRPRETRALFFPDDSSEGIRRLELCPELVFRPFALIVWGAKADTFIRQLRLSWATQFERPVPGWEFESDIPWAEFRALCEPRESLMPRVPHPRELGPFRRLMLPAASAGQPIELTLEGPIEHAVLIGEILVDSDDQRAA